MGCFLKHAFFIHLGGGFLLSAGSVTKTLLISVQKHVAVPPLLVSPLLSFCNSVHCCPCLFLTPLCSEPRLSSPVLPTRHTHDWLGVPGAGGLAVSPPQCSSFQYVFMEHLQARLGARTSGREQGRSWRRDLPHGLPRLGNDSENG